MPRLEWDKIVYLTVFLVVGALVGLRRLEPTVLVGLLVPSPLTGWAKKETP